MALETIRCDERILPLSTIPIAIALSGRLPRILDYSSVAAVADISDTLLVGPAPFVSGAVCMEEYIWQVNNVEIQFWWCCHLGIQE